MLTLRYIATLINGRGGSRILKRGRYGNEQPPVQNAEACILLFPTRAMLVCLNICS